MAAGNIYARLVVTSDTEPEETEYKKIDLHRLGAVIRLRTMGFASNAAVIAIFSLDADGQADLSDLAAAYQVAANKDEWLHSLESALYLYQIGDITEIQCKTILGVS